MEFRQYQQAALKTLQPAPPGADPALIPLLGLAGEAGSVLSAYKKGLRDAPAGRLTKAEMREELGDVLWYLAVVASHIEDSYRFHDIFHLAYVAVLGWSPVMRALLGCKRRSRPDIDEAEDGGRAIAIEEGVSALVFAYAARNNYLDGVQRLDHELLDTIGSMVAHLEVSAQCPFTGSQCDVGAGGCLSF